MMKEIKKSEKIKEFCNFDSVLRNLILLNESKNGITYCVISNINFFMNMEFKFP